MFNDNQSTIKYADIINMPHHVSSKRPHMPLRDRAAQFAPFAALTGHDAAVKETARLTDARVELDEDEVYLINEKLQILYGQMEQQPAAVITYFIKDQHKDGGSYRTVAGTVKRLLQHEGVVIMSDGTEIPIKDIMKINL